MNPNGEHGMFTSRQKLLATIIASYAIACAAVSVGLDFVTARYEAAVQDAEDKQLSGVLNRQIADSVWHQHAEFVATVARAIAQEVQAKHLLDTVDGVIPQGTLPQLSRREAISSGSVALLGIAIARPEGSILAHEGAVPFADPGMDIRKLLAERQGVERLKVLKLAWLCEGQPVLTVIHPVGGLRPVGYVIMHVNPLNALSTLDRQLGMAIRFRSPDGTKELMRLGNWEPSPEARTSRFDAEITTPDGMKIITAEVERDITDRVVMMATIRLWTFACLVGILAAVAIGSIVLILVMSRRMVSEKAHEQFRTAMEGMPQGLCMFDGDLRLVMCNQRYIGIYGLAAETVRPGLTFREIIEAHVANGVYSGDSSAIYIRERMAAVQDVKPSTKIQHLTNGRVICISHRPRPEGGWIDTHDDITDRLAIEAQIAHMAHHDALTDLPNRTLLRERLEDALCRSHLGQQWAVHILDLDRFKEVNDTLGHPIGDLLLREVADRLRTCVNENDTVARLGGDEFAILQNLPNGDLAADALARRILNMVSRPFDLEGHHLNVGTSIGIAVAPKDGNDPDRLMKSADLALYRAKNLGRNRHHFFEPELDESVQARRALEQDLRKALADHEFELHYQALVNLERDEICGFEALLRWNRPGHDQMQPADFIHVAEETGLIVQIGQWVLRRACHDASTWPTDLSVAVNVSPAQFKNREFPSIVVGALASSGLPPGRLELEITESVVLDNSDSTSAILNQLHSLGVRLALDDFGTGYSSLASLRKFPFHKIKIDRSFISDLSRQSENACAIVRSVAELGASLGMITTAEGIETQNQLDQVRAMGCTEFQGYLYSKPRSMGEIGQLIESHNKAKRSVA